MRRITELGDLYSFMRPYQRQGVMRIEEFGGRALLADAPGLGKTLQVIAWAALHPEVRPIVVLCPAVAKHQWRKTAQRWLPDDKVVVLSGQTPSKLEDGTVFIVNYDIVINDVIAAYGDFCMLAWGAGVTPIHVRHNKKFKPYLIDIPRTGWVDYLIDLRPQLIAIDECQKAKNKKAGRTRAAESLVRAVGGGHLICTSGTPADNKPSEFYNALNWIDPELFPSQWAFNMRYCGARQTRWGWDFNGSSNAKELHDILVDKMMIRRTKAEVFKDLPPKIRGIVPLEITNRAEYDYAERNFISWLRSTDGNVGAALRGGGFVKYSQLKQIAAKGKMSQVIAWIDDFLDSDEKLVVFAEHKWVVEEIMKKFTREAVKVDGSTSTKEREVAEDKFQNNPAIRLFVGNIEAAGVSLTLTEASSVAFVELPDTPGQLEQCEDRVYGRTNDPHGANIYFLVALDTKEEDIAEMLDIKAAALTQILDGKDVDMGNMLTELLNKWRGGE